MNQHVVRANPSSDPALKEGNPSEGRASTDGVQWVRVVAPTAGSGLALAPATYTTPGTSLTGKSVAGSAWLTGSAFAVPPGVKALSWVINWTHGGPTSTIQVRIRVGHTAAIMGLSRIRNSSPSISGAIATQTEYEDVIFEAEVGADTVIHIPFDVEGGVAFAALDVQQVTVDGGGDGTVGITIAGSF